MPIPKRSMDAGSARLLIASSLLIGCGARSDLADHKPEARRCGPGCDDRLFCNGTELCDGATGACLPGAPPDCDDGSECTEDRCNETSDRCEHQRVDRDRDGDGYRSCGGDCDDRAADIHPGASETCDGIDQDCDGQADEGLLSSCGDCRSSCELRVLPQDDYHCATGACSWMPTESNSSGLELDPAGFLVLSSKSSESHFAWIANSDAGRVTKLDTRSGAQVAVYDSVLRGPDNHAPAPDEACEQGLDPKPGGNCPSRTAVDFNGAVYVANRAFKRQGTVTKIAGFVEDCVDRNGDGTIQTSTDANDNGRIEPWLPGEYFGQMDECLLWTVDVGSGQGGVPRALAVAKDGTVWVGLHGEGLAIQLDPQRGAILSRVGLGQFKPYGAAIDSRGMLWLAEAMTGKLLSVDTVSGRRGAVMEARPSNKDCPSSYGIAVDHRDRVWLTGFTCRFAFRFDPQSKAWLGVPLPTSGVTRGIAADDRGKIYIASSHERIRLDLRNYHLDASPPHAKLTMLNADDGSELRVWESLPGEGSIGVGLDSNRRVWLVNRESHSATRLDLESGEALDVGVGSAPYTYSDFTGFALRTITAPTGFIRSVVEGCSHGSTQWETLRWDADVPSGARLQVELRSADTLDALAAAPWIGPWLEQPAELGLAPGPIPDGRLLEVRARLVSSDRTHTPALHSITAQLNCTL